MRAKMQEVRLRLEFKAAIGRGGGGLAPAHQPLTFRLAARTSRNGVDPFSGDQDIG